DRPIAGLLKDLKARGLLDDTLVLWGAEFGRTPFAEGGNGRDHNPPGYTMWLAGGGVRGRLAHGETDGYGHRATAAKTPSPTPRHPPRSSRPRPARLPAAPARSP